MTSKKVPMRQCVGCGEMKNKREMIRVIKTSENEIILDATGRRMEEAHIFVQTVKCLKKQKVKGLERSLKTAIPKNL